jgi:hypothetical protein
MNILTKIWDLGSVLVKLLIGSVLNRGSSKDVFPHVQLLSLEFSTFPCFQAQIPYDLLIFAVVI